MTTQTPTRPALSVGPRAFVVTVRVDGVPHSRWAVRAEDEGKAETRAMMAAQDAGLRMMGRTATYDVEAA